MVRTISALLVLGALLSVALCKTAKRRSNRLRPVSKQWIKNTQYSEYRGVRVAENGRIGKEGSDLKTLLLKCNETPSCQGVTETDKNKWQMVKQLALMSAPKDRRLYHKSGTRTITQTTETKVISVSRWTDYGSVGRWGEIKGYKFKQLYGSAGNLKDTMRACKGEKECNGISLVGGKWKKGKGRELVQGKLSWVVGSRMSRSGASRVTGGSGHSGQEDDWHRGHFGINYPSMK